MNTEARIIYNEAFGCDLPFDDALFNLMGDFIQTLEINKKTVSMLFKIPCTVVLNGSEAKAYYIYAAATKKEERSKGYMRKLLNKVSCEKDAVYILKPASKSLEVLYSLCGYKAVRAKTEYNPDNYINVIEKHKKLAEICPAGSSEYTLMYKSDRIIIKDGISFLQTLE